MGKRKCVLGRVNISEMQLPYLSLPRRFRASCGQLRLDKGIAASDLGGLLAE